MHCTRSHQQVSLLIQVLARISESGTIHATTLKIKAIATKKRRTPTSAPPISSCNRHYSLPQAIHYFPFGVLYGVSKGCFFGFVGRQAHAPFQHASGFFVFGTCRFYVLYSYVFVVAHG